MARYLDNGRQLATFAANLNDRLKMIETTPLFDIHQTQTSRLDQVDFNALEFGKVFSDHMFVMEYEGGAWQRGKIEPYGPFTMSPASMVFHYGQAIFEGMKAFRQDNGQVSLFRPGMNIARFNKSAVRMCMPEVPEDIFMEALAALVKLDASWVPDGPSTSLYIRPFMIATDSYVGVRASKKYAFSIFTCPVGAYYKQPVKVKVEKYFTRATPGGTGFAKAAGNYAGSLYPLEKARAEGFDQLLWTDAIEHKYIEESGTMNAMFVLNDVLISPETSDTILDGVTRDTVLKLAEDLGFKVEIRRFSVEELHAGLESGLLTEAFGVGTAATLKPMAEIGLDGIRYQMTDAKEWKIAPRLMREFDGIRRGKIEDRFSWNIPV
ncbi:MAG: branched-chain amino acid aminotransferase [Flavobacteriales bacterium]|nr:branched-chain amino acid aminotransferase [Flavobacteriales bacterium]